jgi:predicted small secreted protein
MFKQWNTGDLVEDDTYDGSTSYNTVEGYEVSDKVNKADLNRPIRNLHENSLSNRELLKNYAKFSSMPNGVIKDALTQEFQIDGDTDFFSLTFNPGTGDTTMYYSRLTPGIAIVNGEVIVSRPQTNILERKLDSILQLENWNNEGTFIRYYEVSDKFQARIIKRDINGNVVNHDYGGTWGDSSEGYDSCLALSAAIYGDTASFGKFLMNTIGVDLEYLSAEPVVRVLNGDSIWWYVDTDGTVVGDSSAGGAGTLALCHFTSSGDSYTSFTDDRTYLQNFNDFRQFIYLNVPQEWGDSDTLLITNPYTGINGVNKSDITDVNSFLVFLDGGDTSPLIGWYGSGNIPGIDKTRTDKLVANRDLIVKTDSGDTLGASWVSIKELSGDSWVFYGDKFFRGASRFTIDATTDISLTAADIYLTAGDSIYLSGDEIYLRASSGSFSINTSGAITLTSASGQNITMTSTSAIVDINGNELQVDSSTFDVNSATQTYNGSTFAVVATSTSTAISLTASGAGGDITIDADDLLNLIGDSIVLSGTTYAFLGATTTRITATTFDVNASLDLDTTGTVDFNLTTSTSASSFKVDTLGGIDLDVDAGFTLNENSGASFSINTSGAITLTSASNQNITISSAGTTGNLILNGGDTIQFQIAGTNKLLLTGTTLYPAELNGSSLGTSTLRFSTGYFTTSNSTTAGIATANITTVLNLPNGTAAAPALRFTSDTNTGIFRIGVDTIGFSTEGTSRLGLNNSTLYPTSTNVVSLGTSSNSFLNIYGTLRTAFQTYITSVGTLTSLTVGGAVTVTGAKSTFAAAAAGYASINLPHGTSPSSSSQGDVWTTTSGVFANVNGTAVVLASTTGSVTEITAGNGMNFTTITASGAVTMGTPSTLNNTTTNATSTNSHTHAITNYALSGTSNQITVSGSGRVLGAATTLSLPQSINTTAAVTFGSVTATTFTGSLSGTATNATNINISTTNGNGNDATMYPVLVGANTTGNQLPHTDIAALYYNASSNILYSPNINATNLTGTITSTSASQPNITSLGTLTSLQIDSININGTVITSSADININAQGINLNAVGDTLRVVGNRFQSDATTFDVNSATQTYNGSTFAVVATSTSTAISLTASGAGGDITISANDLLNVSGDSISLNATTSTIIKGGELQVDSSTFDVNSATQTYNGSTLTHTASGKLTLQSTQAAVDAIRIHASNAAGGIDLDADSININGSNGTISINSSGRIDIDAASGQLVDIYSGTEVQINGGALLDLDATSITINSTNGNISVATTTGTISLTTPDLRLLGTSTYIGAYGVGYKIDDTANVSTYAGYTATNNGLVVSGSFGAYKVFNAVWNDYAEGFEYSKKEKNLIPGMVYKQTKEGLMLTTKRAEKGTVGVYSDTAGMVMGSAGCIIPESEEDQKDKTKIPVGLAGKVRVFIKEKIEIGDAFVSGKGGFATRASIFDKVFRSDRIIGKALECSEDSEEKRIWMLIGV